MKISSSNHRDFWGVTHNSKWQRERTNEPSNWVYSNDLKGQGFRMKDSKITFWEELSKMFRMRTSNVMELFRTIVESKSRQNFLGLHRAFQWEAFISLPNQDFFNGLQWHLIRLENFPTFLAFRIALSIETVSMRRFRFFQSSPGRQEFES